MMAYNFLAVKRVNRDTHRMLSVMALANGGDTKTINEQLAKWEKDD